jgi:plastocyanin
MAAAAGLTWSAAAPVWAGTIEAVVKDLKGKAIDDAVVYVVGAPTDGRPPASATMDQWQQEFIPHVLPVEVGTPVSFPNRDNIRHHVYSFSSTKKFELPLYIGTPAAPVVFDKAGVVTLGCNIHDWMLGYVFVVPGRLFARTGEDGRARIEHVPPGAHEVRVWHPRLKVAAESTTRRITVPGDGQGEVTYTIDLKREFRIPRPATPQYDRNAGG